MRHHIGDSVFNITKCAVVNELAYLLPDAKFCKCNICLDDILALTLTRLPPCYITNYFDLQRTLELYDNKLVKKELSRAIEMVMNNPHH